MKRAVAVVALLAGCGGSAAPSMAPANTDGDHTSATPEDAHPSVQQNQTRQPSAPEIAGARSDLDRAESQVSAATGDCATACRALASMERAAQHLCALDSGRECDRARERLAAARERVRSSCGGCNP
jgi:hypothetical protein